MESLKILVTGHLGYIGSHLVSILKSRGIMVGGVDQAIFAQSVVGDLSPVDIEYREDFRNLQVRDLSQFDAVVHLAALSNDPMGALSPGLTLEINGQGSVDLALKAKEAGISRFVFSSSCSVYGGGTINARTEQDEVNPLSEYAESKLFAEAALTKLNDSSFSVYLLRNATAFGSSKVFRSDLVINDLAFNLFLEQPAILKSDGTQWRPFIHCFDLARICSEFAINSYPRLAGIPINIGFNDMNTQIKSLRKPLLGVWPRGEWKVSSASFPDPRNYQVDFGLFKRALPDFQPKFNFVNGIRDLRDFFLEHGLSSVDAQNQRFIRLVALKQFRESKSFD